jgi:hypothetical protein
VSCCWWRQHDNVRLLSCHLVAIDARQMPHCSVMCFQDVTLSLDSNQMIGL